MMDDNTINRNEADPLLSRHLRLHHDILVFIRNFGVSDGTDEVSD
jgi:hypothetical protein